MITLRVLVVLIALGAARPAVAREDASGALLGLTFEKGQDFSHFDDAVPTGKTDAYTFHARKGQRLIMKVEAPDNDIAYSVYVPGATAWRETYASPIYVEGTTLPGPAEHLANTPWTIVLPATGDYIIVFRSTTGKDSWYGGAIIIR